MADNYEACFHCGQPNYLWDIFYLCPACHFEKEERKRRLAA